MANIKEMADMLDPGRGKRLATDFFDSGCCGNAINIPNNASWYNLVNINTEDSKAIPLTVSLTSAINLPAGAAKYNYRIQARVEWGVSGGFAEAIIDLLNDVSFSVCASSLKVSVRNNSTGAAGASAIISGFVGKGAYANPLNAPSFTGYYAAPIAAAGGTSDQDIPKFARKVRFNRGWRYAGPALPLLPFCLSQLGAGTIHRAAAIIGANQDCPVIDIANSVDTIRITNLDPATAIDSDFANLQFLLGF